MKRLLDSKPCRRSPRQNVHRGERHNKFQNKGPTISHGQDGGQAIHIGSGETIGRKWESAGPELVSVHAFLAYLLYYFDIAEYRCFIFTVDYITNCHHGFSIAAVISQLLL